MSNSNLSVVSNLAFWIKNATSHPIFELVSLIGFAFLSFVSAFLNVLLVSYIVGIAFSYSIGKVLIILVLSLVFILTKSVTELIDGHLVLKGSIALNKANKKIVVPALSNIKYQEIESDRIQELLTEIQKMVRSGDSSKLGQVFRSLWNFFSSLLGFILLSSVFSKLGPFCIITVFIVFVLSSIFRKHLTYVSIKEHNKQLKYSSILRYIERLNTDYRFSKDIRAFDWDDIISRRMNEAINGKCFYHMKEEKALEGGVFVSFIGRMASLFIVVLSFVLAAKENSILNVGEMTFLFLSINSIWSWLETAVKEWQNLSQASNDILKFKELVRQNDVSNTDIRSSMCSQEVPFIVFDSVSFGYKKDRLIFDNFNLSIMKGERIGLVGENGCGKTTLIFLLLGLLEPCGGKILIEGKYLNEYERRQYFAPVFQYLRLYPSSIVKNIIPDSELSKEKELKVKRLSQKLQISRIIENLPLGLDTPLVSSSHDGAIDLSGGETQWIMIMRALMKETPILVFDEINAALDCLGEESLYESMNIIPSNKTILFISHRLAFNRICSRIICLADGKIIEEGKTDDLLNKKGFFYDMFTKQKRNDMK